ncbi:MAG: hypothetical protein P1U56_09215 [Saprospiraceae bacterium]|nr:hypothetical protein [Saprospiraceae bacterium]
MVEEWADWTSYASMFSVIIPLVIFLVKYRNLTDTQLQIGYLVLVTLCCEIGIAILSSYEINSLPVVHLFTVLQFALLVSIFSTGLSPTYSLKFLRGLILFFVVFAMVDASLLNGIFNFNSYSRPLASFLLVYIAIYFFYKTLKELKIKSLTNEPLVWIGIGVILYFSGSLLIFLFTNYVKTSNQALFTLWGIHAIFNIILNITYSIALWIRPMN